MNICHCDWFNKEADWPIAEQNKFRLETKLKMMGRRKAESGVMSRCREKQDEHAVLRKGTWQSTDKKYGLI